MRTWPLYQLFIGGRGNQLLFIFRFILFFPFVSYLPIAGGSDVTAVF